MLKYLLLTMSLIGPASSMASGPITSGGGNVGNSPAATAGLVEFYLGGRVPQILNVVLNRVYKQLADSEFQDAKPLWDKFFERPDIAFKLLQAQRVYINRDRPCKDNNGQDTDASIFSPSGFDICISSFSVGPKLTQLDIVPQLVGLLAHEYGHVLANMNEEDATEIQRRVTILATEVSDIHVPLNNARDHLKIIKDLLNKSQTIDVYANAAAICQIFTALQREHLPQVSAWSPRFSILDWRGQGEIDSLSYKIYSLRRQACIEAKAYDWEKEAVPADFQNNNKALLDDTLNVDIATFYKFYPRRLFPWVRKIAIADSNDSTDLKHNYRIEIQEIQSLVELLSANVEALYWLKI